MDSNNQHTAVLVMDMQSAILQMLPDSSGIANQVATVIQFARAHQLPVVYVVVGFRPGMPEISSNNKGFAASRERLKNARMEEWMKIDESVQPELGEIIVTKRRVSAFTGSDLEVVLRAKGIQHLVLTGIATSGVVLSTVREAADKDYRITVLSDACADADEEIHRVLTTKVFPKQAAVMTVADWCRL